MVLCLLVLAIVLLFAQAMGTLGIQHLGLVQADYHDRVSAYAAEAGAARALHEIAAQSTWSAGWVKEPLTSFTRSAYTVQVTSNTVGAVPVTAPDGAMVPPGHVYILSTGTCLDGRYPRQTSVMLSPGSWFPYALASGGKMSLAGAADITGSIRSGGDMTFQGRVTVVPDNGQGRVLVAGVLDIGSLLTMDASQDVRAREDILDVVDVRGTTEVFAFDATTDTDPFDTSSPIPEPDRAALLAGAVEHAGATTYRNRDELDLGGKVHYFPDGVSFLTGSKLTGSGTIVTGGGHTAKFDIPLQGMDMNVVAFDSGVAPDEGEVGDAKIEFNANVNLNGVVFCEGDILSRAALDVTGAIIAFGGGSVQQVNSRAALRLVRARPTSPLPGFEDLFGSGGVNGGLSVDSWQRL